MSNYKKISNLPKTVEEVAKLLILEMSGEHMETMANMNDEDFDMLYEKVSPLLLEEFKIWGENIDLLNSSISLSEKRESEVYDPARIILETVRNKLCNVFGELKTT